MTLRRILLAFTITLSLLLTFGFAPLWEGAWIGMKEKYENWREASRIRARREQVSKIQVQNAKPLMILPERPGDRARYPRESFAIRYVDENGFGIDTASGMVQFDRIVDPDTMIALSLTNAQVDSLYEMALRGRMFEMDQPQFLGTLWAGADHWGGLLTLYSRDSERSFRWDYWNSNVPWTEEHKRLNAFVNNLTRMVKTSPTYLQMPRPRGLYID